MREQFDLSKYFVIGPENTKGRPVPKMIQEVVEAGFTMIQIRSKTSSAREIIKLTGETASLLSKLGKEEEVSLVVNDRLDVVLAAREQGINVDGIHIGQSDIPPEVCRKYLGEDSIVGVSARTHQLFDYVKTADTNIIDYFGAGPLHETATKPDCGQDIDGSIRTRDFEEIQKLSQLSPLPVVLGGGVKKEDLKELAQTGVDGFFVVSAISEANNPKKAAKELVQLWEEAKKENDS